MDYDKNADKRRKKLIREELKRLTPSECQKYIRLVIDANFTHDPMGRELLVQLETSELKYDIRTLPEKFCIIWERSLGQQIFVSKTLEEIENSAVTAQAVTLSDKIQIENHVIRIFSTENFEQCLQNESLDSIVERLKPAFPDNKLTLLIPSLPPKTPMNAHIKRETLLTEIQIMHHCNIIQIKSDAELLEVLKRFTKAIAEEPYKKNKSEPQDKFTKFLLNDNKKCVRVEGIHGLGRLWQQHLNRLPLITLDVAEAIRAEYSCPKKMITDIREHPDAAAKIANLPVSRGIPVLNPNRRIGNALSSKLIKLYESRDPNEQL